MTNDIKAIRDALQAGPTPGPWRYWACKVDDRVKPPMYDYAQFANLKEHVFRAPLRYITEPDAQWIAAVHPERIARLLDALELAQKDAELIRAQADAEATERLSMIADELIAGLGEPGRGLAEMLREGIVALESYAASVVLDVRRQALEEAARVCESEPERRRGDGVWAADQTACAQAVRALKDKP